MRILIATDAAAPQVNGVVKTYERLSEELSRRGCDVRFLTPDRFGGFGLPGYREIRLAWPDRRRVASHIDDVQPDHIHIATEGPIGWMMRSVCMRTKRRFTTSYHTKLPEYASAYTGMPVSWGYWLARRFHNASSGTMVATPSLAAELRLRGFQHIVAWTRGVDTNLFRPRDIRLFGSDEPVFMYVGRIAREKTIEAFLDLDLPGKKVLVGKGPHLEVLRQRYPEAIFTGAKSGEQLAEHFASADVFVFPSRSDTFGLVLLEAMASGVPVAAFPVTGPRDLVRNGETGILDEDLRQAALNALKIDRTQTRAHALTFSWANTADQFLANIAAAHELPLQVAANRNENRKLSAGSRLGALPKS